MLFRRRQWAKSFNNPSGQGKGASRRLARAASGACEMLESRCLLTALINGTFQGTNTPYDGTTVFEYHQTNPDSLVRISVHGNITAEFIGGIFDPAQPSNVRLADLTPATAPTTDPATNLFSIYVVKSDMNSTISIAVVPALTSPNRPMDPFTGTVTLRTNNGNTGETQLTTTPAGNGGVLIGVTSPAGAVAPTNSIPQISADQRQFGMRPSSAGELFAGLEVAPGNDLGRFFVGGTITGLVDVPGSMETFYAGSILTGTATGLPQSATSEIHRNFFIGKDIRNLIAGTSFGTDTSPVAGATSYNTGFQLDIGGRVGQVLSGDSFLGAATIRNLGSVQGPGIAQREVEFRGRDLTGSASYFDPTYFGNDISLRDFPAGAFNNDTFDTAQWLGTAFSRTLKSSQVIQLTGSLNNNGDGGDNVDYYAVALLAGQTMTVQLTSSSALPVGIFDPDDRLIASTFTNDIVSRTGGQLQITADRPGGYRIAIARDSNTTFTPGGGSITGSTDPYELRIQKVGDIALGGLIAHNVVATPTINGTGVQVLSGDAGEISAATLGPAASATIWSYSKPWYLPSGNLRSMEAFDIGSYFAGVTTFGDANGVAHSPGPDLLIRKGTLGLVNQTDAAGSLVINDDTPTFPTPADDLSQVNPSLAVGKNIQLISAAGELGGDLLAKGSIGVIHAARVGNTGIIPLPVWMANISGTFNSGAIDLVDISENLGTLGRGGPAIWIGAGGNIRYMHVAGDTFRDASFGGGSPEVINALPGKKVRITDDSGTSVVLTPTPLEPNTSVVIGQESEFIDPPSLSVLTYPIRSGGSVIVSVTVTPALTITPSASSIGGGGLTVQTGANGGHGSAEIGQINISAAGIPFTFDPITRKYTEEVQPNPPTPTNPAVRPINLLMKGDSTIDVWNINAPGVNFHSIINKTKGEIVNITGSPNVFDIEGRDIGIARSSTGAAVNGVAVIAAPFPFDQQQRTLIQVGSLANAAAGDALGNILATNIGSISGGSRGIIAPIYSNGTSASATLGNIVSVNIGGGLASSGTGNVVFSGLYADNIIDSIRGSNADIRGNIVASGSSAQVTQTDPITNEVTSSPLYIIGKISLTNGSIIDSDVLLITAPSQSVETNRTGLTVTERPTNVDPQGNFVDVLDSIRLQGNGGIIGSTFIASDIGAMSIKGGYGMVNSFVTTHGTGDIAGVTTDGYGIRNCLFEGGATIGSFNVQGNGKSVSIKSFSASVRQSEKGGSFDNFSTNALDAGNDLDLALGLSAKKPVIKGISATGSIEDTVIQASRSLEKVVANRIIGRDVFVLDPVTGKKRRIPYGSQSYPMQINIGNHIGTIQTRDVVDGLALTTGQLDKFTAGNNVQNSKLVVRGHIGQISTAGAFRGTTTIQTVGPDGLIDSISTGRSLYATVNVSADIVRANVGTDLGSTFFGSSGNIRKLHVNGSILSGAYVRAKKRIINLFVGGDIKAGATVQAHAIENQTVLGQVLGDIIIV